MHLKNRHKGAYDFPELVKSCPGLAQFVAPNPYGTDSIDFSNPAAVKTLNKALLKHFYNIDWDLPKPYLCPPIPSRADYIHTLSDLLTSHDKKTIILDIGVGANCIYPLIGQREYGWRFVGTDVDPKALKIARGIIQKNGLAEMIELRLQNHPSSIFETVVKDEIFDISMCNPPFHASPNEAKTGTLRKWKNLGIKGTVQNFGGQGNELWYPGGEVLFIKRMIAESVRVQCKWFTTLVSKEASLPLIYSALDKVRATEVRAIPTAQGNKTARIIAWTFQK
jgi:23S rRNA (adenine1618-N6)-methyltransferase